MTTRRSAAPGFADRECRGPDGRWQIQAAQIRLRFLAMRRASPMCRQAAISVLQPITLGAWKGIRLRWKRAGALFSIAALNDPALAR